MANISVRSIVPSDVAAIRSLFETSMLLGRPHSLHLDHFDRYADLCLGWYLTEGRASAAVAELDGRMVGYALVCTDPTAQARWVRQRMPGLVWRVLWRLFTGRLDRVSRQFYWLRTLDSWDLWRGGAAPAQPVHAHLNVDATARSGSAALALRDFIDVRATEAGALGWYGEMNAIEGSRSKALERIGLHIVHRANNRTMTALLEVPVMRLTIERHLPTPDIHLRFGA